MASYDQHLAYLAEHDPARALQEYRRRKAATPQQKAHAPLTLSQQGRQSDIPASAEADQKAMANLSIRAAKAREMKADQSTTGHQAYGLGSFADRDLADVPFGIAFGQDRPLQQFDPAKLSEYRRLQQSSSRKRSWLSCLINEFA